MRNATSLPEKLPYLCFVFPCRFWPQSWHDDRYCSDESDDARLGHRASSYFSRPTYCEGDHPLQELHLVSPQPQWVCLSCNILSDPVSQFTFQSPVRICALIHIIFSPHAFWSMLLTWQCCLECLARQTDLRSLRFCSKLHCYCSEALQAVLTWH